MLESMTASMVEEVMKENVAKCDIDQIADGGKGATPIETVEFMSDFITSSKIYGKSTVIAYYRK